MTQRRLTEEEVEFLVSEGGLPMDDKLPETYKVHEEGEWEDEGKYSHQEVIVHSLADDTYWSVNVTRSGSYFTDYDYMYDTTLTQVEKKEVVVTKWLPVKTPVSSGIETKPVS